MSQLIKEFLTARLTLPGVAAWGAQLSPGDFISQSQYDWLTAARLQQTHQELTLAAERLLGHNLKPSKYCWVFEHIRIYFAARKDGMSLACYTQNVADAPVTEIEGILQDFVR